MSAEEEDQTKKVACSAEDVVNVREYSTHFNVSLPDDLIKALDTFEKDQTFENQNEFKLQMALWMTTSEHESFKDSLWDAPKTASNDAIFDLQFDKDVKEEFTTPVKED